MVADTISVLSFCFDSCQEVWAVNLFWDDLSQSIPVYPNMPIRGIKITPDVRAVLDAYVEIQAPAEQEVEHGEPQSSEPEEPEALQPDDPQHADSYRNIVDSGGSYLKRLADCAARADGTSQAKQVNVIVTEALALLLEAAGEAEQAVALLGKSHVLERPHEGHGCQ